MQCNTILEAFINTNNIVNNKLTKLLDILIFIR